jgi:ankyrin repeat protein
MINQFGGNPAITDVEGWNALHWAAFHGCVTAAEVLVSSFPQLLSVQDKEGNTPLDTAKQEKNDDVVECLVLASESKKSK